jgi:mono/diheme cytochrome c family protein
VTEIPEHLLKRSRERRAALGLSTGGEEGAAGSPPAEPPGEGEAAATPAPATPAAPARRPAAPEPAAPPPPKPDPPYVRAAKRRRKIPVWALPVLALLPLWALLYALAMRPPEVTLSGPLAEGAELFAGKCASCHGTTGQGGVGYELNNGEVLKTFPGIEAHLEFVTKGSQVFAGQVYGDPNRPGGPHVGLARNGTAMPPFGTELTPAEIMAVVCHERYTLSGGDQTGEEFLQYCAPDAPKFVEAEAAG